MIREVISLYGLNCQLFLIDKIDEENTKVFGDIINIAYRDQVTINLLPKDVPNIERINGLFNLPIGNDFIFFVSVQDLIEKQIHDPQDILESVVEFPDKSLYVIKHVNIKPEGIVYPKLLANSSVYELTMKPYQQRTTDQETKIVKDDITQYIVNKSVNVGELF